VIACHSFVFSHTFCHDGRANLAWLSLGLEMRACANCQPEMGQKLDKKLEMDLFELNPMGNCSGEQDQRLTPK
jgi:hypothetical protein